ncbi:MAG: hypothetical protein OXH63_11535 [Gemmatimonadetes bacterium]|nr:hypothetical protein [Gemmatimonadota bacterium]
MAATPKRTHLPLFPPGLREIKAQDVDHLFVGSAFDTPLRRRMVAALQMFIVHLRGLGVHGDLWIDGSFATMKPEPGDIDLALFIPGVIVNLMPADGFERLRCLSDEENRAYVRAKWQVDFYVCDLNDTERRDYFLELFSRNPDRTNSKGIPFLAL